MTQGNKAIRDHKEDGRDLHLFESNDEAWSVTYLGQFECVDWFEEQQPDTNGDLRKAIRFKLEPIDSEVTVETNEIEEADLDTLYEQAQTSSSETREKETITTEYTRPSDQPDSSPPSPGTTPEAIREPLVDHRPRLSFDEHRQNVLHHVVSDVVPVLVVKHRLE